MAKEGARHGVIFGFGRLVWGKPSDNIRCRRPDKQTNRSYAFESVCVGKRAHLMTMTIVSRDTGTRTPSKGSGVRENIDSLTDN